MQVRVHRVSEYLSDPAHYRPKKFSLVTSTVVFVCFVIVQRHLKCTQAGFDGRVAAIGTVSYFYLLLVFCLPRYVWLPAC